MKIDDLTYEESIENLEKLIEKMETEDISLEESVECFKKATEFYNHSRDILNKAEGEIKVILEKDNGNQKESDFLLEG